MQLLRSFWESPASLRKVPSLLFVPHPVSARLCSGTESFPRRTWWARYEAFLAAAVEESQALPGVPPAARSAPGAAGPKPILNKAEIKPSKA